ncbi:hypothetical protein [Daejeonella sp.]|jgi:hypothetical protein|uniref:hypothetical protein n=1 Tax=Daejeonella sp. TaxID=2805397 RepID=UPI0037BE264E
MPASLQLNQLENQWLFKLVEKQFDLQIVDSYSCQKLSNELLINHKTSISYNTIRRIFGIITPKFQSSLYTLNSLVSVLGFTNFRHFQSYIEKYKTDALNEVLIRYKATKSINSNLLFESIQHFNLQSWEEAFQLKLIIDLCITTNHYDLLSKIIQLPLDIKDQEVHHKLYVAYQDIYLNALAGNQVLIDFVSAELPNSIYLQSIILQTYIDETNLTGFYGDWLIAVKASPLSDFAFFKNVMLCQRAYQQNEIQSAQKFLNLALKEINNKVSAHPILMARVAAWEIILNLNERNYLTYFERLNNDFEQINFNLFFYRLLYVFNQDISKINLITKIKDQNAFKKLSVFEKQIINKYNLMLALYFDKTSDNNNALKHINQVDPRRFDVNDGQWFNEKYKWLKSKNITKWAEYS